MNNQKILAFALSISIFALTNCAPSGNRAPVSSLPATTPFPVRTAIPPPTEPEIGMKYEALEKMCGEGKISTFETAKGETATVSYVYTTERGKNNCFGTFTFVNNRLDSISRN